MESCNVFKAKMQEAGNDAEKMNEIINERLQMYINEIMSVLNPYSAVDKPFILAAFKMTEDAFKETCCDGVEDAVILLRSHLKVDTRKANYKE